ncbi:MAG: integration host factor subunit beta [Deltaproteobacteria bacterium]|nr:integration host factor subunit beta [Deltaproteobacteria bacterium]
MNKSELVEKLAERAKITKKRAEQVVNLVFEQMTEALRRGDRIEIRGFGSFTSKAYDAYTGRNPRTGETIHVPAKRLPFFKVGKELKERVDYPPGAMRPGLKERPRTDGVSGANGVGDDDDDDDDDVFDEDADGDED